MTVVILSRVFFRSPDVPHTLVFFQRMFDLLVFDRAPRWRNVPEEVLPGLSGHLSQVFHVHDEIDIADVRDDFFPHDPESLVHLRSQDGPASVAVVKVGGLELQQVWAGGPLRAFHTILLQRG